MKRYKRGLWWIKRDFRINDNDALLQAIEECEKVAALFIIEPSLCHAEETSYFHYHAWDQGAQHLAATLQKCGATLNVVTGEAVTVLDNILGNNGFDAIFSHEETGSNISFMRDKAVQHWASQNNIVWHEAHQNGVIRRLADRDQRQPVIRDRLFNTHPRSAPRSIHSWPIALSDHPQINTNDPDCWPTYESLSGSPIDKRIDLSKTQLVDEQQAHADLASFLEDRGLAYSGGISSPNTAFQAGSRLSAHLAWGTVSLRQVFHATWERDRDLARSKTPEAYRWRKSLKSFQSRLHWHDHFMQRLESAPEMEFTAINPAYNAVNYGDNTPLMQAWENGKTGLPLVDACMRCLAATGFLNFRMRAMVVSAGCFGLAQSWKSLYYPLARLFLDYEPGIHFSQIQMQAGIVGINTLRVYSPLKQLLDQDPEATFIKQWIPELREFDATQIAAYNDRNLGDYPEPVTDITINTQTIRDQIYAIRKSDAGREASAQVLLRHGSRLSGNDRQTKKKRKRVASKNTKQNSTKTKAHNDAQMSFDFNDEGSNHPE